jgi:hypothetical protein
VGTSRLFRRTWQVLGLDQLTDATVETVSS